MSSVTLISTSMHVYLLFNILFHVSAQITENMLSKPEWKMALQKIEKLQEIVRFQDERISTLEKRTTESDSQAISELHKIVKKQNDRIAHLETRIQKLETVIKAKEYTSTDTPEKELFYDTSGISVKSNENLIRRGKPLNIQTKSMLVNNVAFFAYLSSNTPTSDAHRIIAFDTVITNVGNAYHPHSGTFIAPQSGLYVFTWTIRLYATSYHTTELLVDSSVVNWIYFNPNNNIDGSVTGTAVVHVNQGDDVLIRTGHHYNNGAIISDQDGKSSFAGWILM